MSTFGPNSAYINELYFEYLKNPSAFDEQWQAFFAGYDPLQPEGGDGAVILAQPAVETRVAEKATTQGAAPAYTNGAQQAPTTSEPQPVAPPAEEVKPEPKAAGAPPEGGKKLSGVPLRIAQNMKQSLEVPTATSFREMPVKLLEENRTLINGYMKASDQGKVSFTHIIAWAIVKALDTYPSLNNGYQESDGQAYLLERPEINFGLAIDLEKPGGGRTLVVPNVKNAGRMNFREFYSAYDGIVKKARDGKLELDDFMGTTITLTNPGTIGTIASVPRLMVGQGAIIATGSINYPAAYQAMDSETLSELGVSKVMQLTSTYDHRIIQGAESGLFLARVQALLIGENNFYGEIFESLQIPYRPLEWQRDRHPAIFGSDRKETIVKQQRVLRMINNFRVRGHLQAHLDPLGEKPQYHPDLDPATYGLTIWDFDRKFMTGGIAGMEEADLRTILSILRDTYTQRIGVEYMYIQDWDQKLWLQEQMETNRNQPKLTPEQKKRVLKKLIDAEVFEKFLQTKYTGHKRFSMEGAESTIPMLDELVTDAAESGAKELLIGMAHRGRLNVLVNMIGKNAQRIFSEFEDINDPENSVQGSGDVKYHLGAYGTYETESGKKINVRLAPNPSHLEAVDPIIEGLARALQDKDGPEGTQHFIPLLIHGDAAFAGQGVVAETLNMSQLKGYHTGGTIHLVINNQIGFTASPADTRSGIYATDVAKMVQAPVFHVNGDDPEAAMHVMRLAFQYRQRFQKDVVVDLYCYRRYGHNETDEPMYTQPLLYTKIKAHPSTRVVYTERLLRNGTLTQESAHEMEETFKNKLEALLAATKAQVPPPPPEDPLADQRINPADTWTNPATGIPAFVVDHIAEALANIPDEIQVHPKLVAQFKKRPKLVEEGKIDWAFAEAIAFGSLLLDGNPVRLSGQDAQRGTFSHRHAVLHGQETGNLYIPLNQLSETQQLLKIYDSPLSEYAVLGFEYGYSVADPDALVLWEAQFGDFVNGAQIVIDQYISSSEDKWGMTSGVVMLLPHGFEGQGPEHSSARLERFLTLCAEDNMQVVAPTTPAQYFHVLRRQVKREIHKPLIVMSPKSLLRHRLVISTKDKLTSGTFQSVLPETEISDPKKVTRLVLCSGKVYYDLLEARTEKQQENVAIVRIEQLYPCPVKELQEQFEQYSHVTDVVFVQEEPKNMGAWPTLSHWIRDVLMDHQKLSFLGRPASGSPASGSGKHHKREQDEIVRRTLAV